MAMKMLGTTAKATVHLMTNLISNIKEADIDRMMDQKTNLVTIIEKGKSFNY